MTALSGFGLFAVTAMLIAYALSSLYGFLRGAWPFGLVEAVWALVALRKWSRR